VVPSRARAPYLKELLARLPARLAGDGATGESG